MSLISPRAFNRFALRYLGFNSIHLNNRLYGYAVNANAYFIKPGQRAMTGLEILAKIIDPEVFKILNWPLIHLSK